MSKATHVYIGRMYTFGLDTAQEWIGVCDKMRNCIKSDLEIITEAQNCCVCTGALEAGWPQTPAVSRASLSGVLGTCGALRSSRMEAPQLIWAICFSL